MSEPLDATGAMTPLAVVPVRDGRPAPGGSEAAAAAGGRAWLVGTDAEQATRELEGAVVEVLVSEVTGVDPGALATALAPHLGDRSPVILPASADGRDLAPHLAHLLDRPLVCAAIEVSEGAATVVTHGGRIEHDIVFDGPAVVTIQPGALGVDPDEGPQPSPAVVELEPPATAAVAAVDLEASLPPDPATMDLSDADRIVAGGAGVGGPEAMELLGRIGVALGASLGATRVVTDAGWTEPERQIGTTGVEVTPSLYVALGISGAVQHVMGLGAPEHVISVNLDRSCPMMGMADLAVVCDAQELLPALAARLGVDP